MRMIPIMIVMIMVFDEDDNGGISDHGKYLDSLETFQSVYFFALLREHVIKSFTHFKRKCREYNSCT